MRGAGGSSGGLGQFFIGFFMFCGGVYMLLNSITFYAHHGFGSRVYSFGSFNITSGMIMIPFMFGVGMIFYNAKNIFGWLLAAGSLTALVFGVISSIQFQMRSMSAFDLAVILVLTVGGIGLFLRSLKSN
ncbi:hypothetical protein NBRC116583_16650 [Arenicella sp. 4NH20-0111]|uniref:hypothetical protein n=1 Tax=Arenicella sp. 4NH20-0111 TaxID=3127648 RepID=UPI0031071D9C